MDSQVYVYFSLIVLTLVVTATLSIIAWRQPEKPGVKAYAVLAAIEAGTAVTELLSMFSVRQEMAYFWFNFRFIFNASMPVYFFIFAFRYNAGRHWLNDRLIAALFIIPLITQVMVWTNPIWHLWVRQDVSFTHIGQFWITQVGTRVPGVWFMVHSFYTMALMFIGIAVLFIAAWRTRQRVFWRSLLLTLGAMVGLLLTLNTAFNLLKNLRFNIFVPGIGLSALIYGLAILRFDFFKAKENPGEDEVQVSSRYEVRTVGGLIVILAILLTGIATIAYFSYQSYAENQYNQVKSQLLSIAKLKVEGLADWRRERVGDAISVSQNRVMSDYLAKYLINPDLSQLKRELESWLDGIRQAYDYERVLLVDNEGEVLFRSPHNTNLDPVHIRELVVEMKNAGTITWRDFHFHEDGHIQVSILAPIFSNDDPGRLLGVILLEVDPAKWLYPYLQQWPIASETAETLLVRKEEQGVVFLTPVRFNQASALTLRLSDEQNQVLAVKGGLGVRGVVEGLDYRGEKVIGAIAEVPDSPWILVARMDESEALAPMRARFWQTVFFFGFMGLAISSGIVLMWRQRAMRYYQEQLRAAESIAESEEKFRKAFMLSPDSVSLSKTESGEILMVNEGFTRIFGFTAQEAIGSTFLKLKIWLDATDRERYIQKIKETGGVHDYEVSFKTKDGRIRTGLVSGTLIELEGESHLLHTTRDITEERKAQQDYRMLFREMLDGLALHEMVYDGNGKAVDYRFLSVNPAFERLTGLEAGKIIGHTVMEVLPGLEKSWIEHYNRVVQSGEPITFENYSKELNMYFQVTAFKSGPMQFVTIFVDITHRKNAEQALLAYNDRLKTLTNILQYKAESTQEFLDYALEQSIRLTSSKIGYIYFYDEERQEFTLNSWSKEVMKECKVLDPQTCYELAKTGIWGEAVRQRKPVLLNDFQAANSLKKGYPPGHVSLHKYLTIPVFDNDRIMAVVAVANKEEDYTELDVSQLKLLMDAVWKVVQKKRSEEAVKLSEARYRLMAENTTDVIWVVDAKSNRFKYVSPSVYHLRGYTAEEVLAQPFDAAVLPEARQAVKSIVSSRCKQFLENGAVPISFIDELQQPCKDGRIIPTEVTSTYLQNEQGELEIIGVSRDITARKEAEKALKEYSEHLEDMVEERTRELREAQERLLRQERLATLGQLAGSIAHELRNPLGVISNASTFLNMVLPAADSKVNEYLNIIDSETQNAEKIIADLLDFTRMQVANRQPIGVRKTVENALARHPAPANVDVVMNIAADLPDMFVDGSQVEQVLGNLIDNAYHAMTNGGTLEVTGELAPEDEKGIKFIRINVKDSGVGIPPENQSRIFEPLFTTRAKGIGLGLAISKKYIEANAGKINLTSENGKGTKFTIELPVAKEKK